MLNSGQATGTQDLEKIRQDKFADWLRKKVLSVRDGDRYIRMAGVMPSKQAKCYEGYEVNGFRFHTKKYGQNKSTESSCVCIKGEWDENGPTHDYYGVLEEVIELEYDANTVVLFRCYWFDITNGVKVDHEHGLVEVKHIFRLKNYEPFVLACQALQVCYLPYASENRERRQWWVAIKTSPKGKFRSDNADANLEFYQEEMSDNPTSVSNGQDIDWDGMVLQEDEFDLVDNAMDLSPTISHAPQSMARDDNSMPIEECDEDHDMEQGEEEIDWFAFDDSDEEY